MVENEIKKIILLEEKNNIENELEELQYKLAEDSKYIELCEFYEKIIKDASNHTSVVRRKLIILS